MRVLMVVATGHQRNCQICQVLVGKTAAQPGTVSLCGIDFLCAGEYNTERAALGAGPQGDDGQLLIKVPPELRFD
jgi:hypothetical protein